MKRPIRESDALRPSNSATGTGAKTPAVKPDFAQMTLDKLRLVHNQALGSPRFRVNGIFSLNFFNLLIFNSLFLAEKAGKRIKRYTPLAVSRTVRALSTKLSTEIVDNKNSHSGQAG